MEDLLRLGKYLTDFFDCYKFFTILLTESRFDKTFGLSKGG